jgi:peptidoglycan/LPS O-acetylase OafA/YrhL
VPLNEKRVFFPNLDGLRFVAFLLVFLGHAWGQQVTRAGRFLGAIITCGGGLGVSLFFVLSGFLITYLLLVEHEAFGAIDVGAFYVRRCLRIWPLYFLVLVLALVVYPAVKVWFGFPGTIEVGNPLLYWTFLSNFDVIKLGRGHGAGVTNIMWSIAVEEQFYLLWPLLLIGVGRRRLPLLSVVLVAASSAYRLTHLQDLMQLHFHSLSVMSDLVIGGFAAYLCRTHTGFIERLRGLRRDIIAAAYLVGLGCLFWSMDTRQVWLFGLGRVFLALFFAFVILEQNYASSSPFKMSRFPAATFLGRYTYGLYLLHVWCLMAIQNVLRLRGSDSARWPVAYGLISLGLSIGVAIASYHWYERPFLKLKERFSRVRTAPPVPESAVPQLGT